jgi:hypothetical protein
MDARGFFSKITAAAKGLAARLRRRQPGMIGTPPSARQVPADPAMHALDFSERYAEPLDYDVSQRMLDLGIDPAQIGMPDYAHNIRHAAFHPHGRQGGSISPDGRITVDSGILNPDLLKKDYGRKAGKLFERARLRDRLDSILAHEYEEHRTGSHAGALKAAPKTDLPISDRAREIAGAMEKGWSRR